MSQTQPDTPGSLGQIVGGLATDVQDLVKGEIALARSELDQKLNRMIAAAIWLVGGALVAFAGLVVVLEGAAALLALAVPVWVSFLIVGVLIVAVGALIARSGLSIISLQALVPDRTAENLQKDARMVKEHT